MTAGVTFRASVGAVVIDPRGLVLALERSDVPGAWQLPQGGLAAGEEPRQAVLRELCEETGVGLGSVEIVAEHPDWLAYELPPQMRRSHTGLGQVQKWFLLRFTGATDEIDPAGVAEPEFSDWQWMPMRQLVDAVAPFRRRVYAAVRDAFAAHLNE